jgi:hypothetical protein
MRWFGRLWQRANGARWPLVMLVLAATCALRLLALVDISPLALPGSDPRTAATSGAEPADYYGGFHPGHVLHRYGGHR